MCYNIRGEIKMVKRKYKRKEMNYDRPTNRLVKPTRLAKSSPKKMGGLRLLK
tara:strand:- start:200 stop:355 length:156 start_codon:yes stop_codon:yes gene_type:complete